MQCWCEWYKDRWYGSHSQNWGRNYCYHWERRRQGKCYSWSVKISKEVTEHLITNADETKILPESPVPEIKKKHLEDISKNKEQIIQALSKKTLKLSPSAVLTFPSPVSSPLSLKYVSSTFQTNTTCSSTVKPNHYPLQMFHQWMGY